MVGRGFCVIRNYTGEQLNAGARLFAFKSDLFHYLDVQYLACFFSFCVYPSLLKKKKKIVKSSCEYSINQHK